MKNLKTYWLLIEYDKNFNMISRIKFNNYDDCKKYVIKWNYKNYRIVEEEENI